MKDETVKVSLLNALFVYGVLVPMYWIFVG
jgi:hypothetical protein